MIDRTLVIGNGACAHRIVSLLLEAGKRVVQATRESRFSLPDSEFSGFKSIERLTDTIIERCDGHVGSFRIHLTRKTTRNDDRLEHTVGTVIIAEEPIRQSNIDLYGLSGCPSVYSISRVRNGSGNEPEDRLPGKRIVFLTGLHRESHPACFSEIVRVAHLLQSRGFRTCILTDNLKVAGNGLESRVWEYRRGGGVVFKFSGHPPRIAPSDPMRISFLDEVTRENQTLCPDAVVVDETVCPSPELNRLSRIFRLDTDAQGFLQSGNVHRLSVKTNRKGILAAGPSRSIQTEAQEEADAHAAAITAFAMGASPVVAETLGRAEIDPGRCIRCLTCYRLCPHCAVSLGSRVAVAREACEGCGICVPECPRGAIRLSDPDHAQISERITRAAVLSKNTDGAPFLVAFCCRQSAAIAAARASEDGFHPGNLLTVPVPCAGSLSIDLILASFLAGAKGVLVLACHDGNCRSERGNRFATERMGRLSSILSEVGIETGRVGMDSLAANMGTDFVRRVRIFEQKIRCLNESSAFSTAACDKAPV